MPMGISKKDIYWTLIRNIKRIKFSFFPARLPAILTKCTVGSNVDSRFAYNLRQIFDAILPKPEIISEETFPEIDVLICCTEKDAKNLVTVVSCLKKYSTNPIRTINIISPTQLLTLKNGSAIEGCAYWLDSEIISNDFQEEIRKYVPPKRFNWVLQQALKVSFTLKHAIIPILILDADTCLLKPHTFVDLSNSQLLNISYEFHKPYNTHSNKFFNIQNKNLSYVTHFQLWKPSVIHSMFPVEGHSLLSWIASGDFHQESPVSEFHSYGSWILTNNPSEVRIASWRNINFIPRELANLENEIFIAEKYFGSVNSISMHSYLKES